MIRRKLKNVIKNYTECEILVREATSNEAWGPSNSILSKIAELSNHEPNIVHIMPLIWKRLKDKGKKWRHVYKSLLLMHFLVTRGNISISEYCRRNIHFIQSLESFQYVEGKVDVGSRIRKRATDLIVLLKDNDLLKSERHKAMITDLRFSKDIVSQGSNVPIKYGNGVGSLSQGPSTGSFISSSENKEVAKADCAPPTSSLEEDIQLQIALAESKEEAERQRAPLADSTSVPLTAPETPFDPDFDSGPWSERCAWTGGGSSLDNHLDNDPWAIVASSSSDHGLSTSDPWGVMATAPPLPVEHGNPWNDPWSQPVQRRALHDNGVSANDLLPDYLRPASATVDSRRYNPFLTAADPTNPFLVDIATDLQRPPPGPRPHYNPFLS